MQQRLLLINEVSERTRLSPATLRWFRHNNTGPQSAKLGRRIVYREADVETWIENQFAEDHPVAS